MTMIKNRLPEYLDAIGLRPADGRRYRCISGTHEDAHPSMSLHPGGKYLHCFSCGETFYIYDVAAWRLGLPCDKANFLAIAREVKRALGIPDTWKPTDAERREHWRNNRDIAGRQMIPLSESSIFRGRLLREFAEAVDFGNMERAVVLAELLFTLALLPEGEKEAKPERVDRAKIERERIAARLVNRA